MLAARWLLASLISGGWGIAHAEPVVPAPPSPPGGYDLRWTAPRECPTAEAIRARVAELALPSASGEGVAMIDGVVTASDGFELVLTTRFETRTQQRRMRAAECSELAEGTAIVIAVALTEGLEVAMAEPPPVTTPEPPAEAEPTPAAAVPTVAPRVEPPLSTTRSQRVPPPQPRIRFAGVGEIGALGAVTGGLQLAIATVWPRARAELHGVWLGPRLRIDASERVEARFQAGLVGARGCWQPPLRIVELPLCAGFDAGVVRVAPRFASQRVRQTPWGGPGVGIAVVRALGPVRIWLGVDAFARVIGSRFHVDGRRTFDQLPVSVRWALGLEIPLGVAKKPHRVDTARSKGAS